MPTITLTLDNPIIKSYLEGKTDAAPVSEFLYVHSYRPQPNFLSEIESIIKQAEAHLLANPRKSGVSQKLDSLARKIAESLGEMNETRAAILLELIRDVYQICNRLPYSHV